MKKGKLWMVRGIVILLAVSFILFGIMQGEPYEVLKKAVNICLQCIGIG
ncbi:MAG: CD1871A family CXXC motif-containing protein [Candidatus Limivivens sp.]|nr:CD1871A family CXXC motif-containing protein [Candidatus Limivivens sp.]